MLEIRIIGGIVGAVALLSGWADIRRSRRSRIRQIRDYVTVLLGFGLIVLAVFPRLFDAVARIVGIDTLEGRRIGILTVLAVAVLGWAIYEAVGKIAALNVQIGDLATELAVRTPNVAPARLPEGFIAAVIPAFNEAENLPHVLSAMPHEVVTRPLVSIVVSDGSTDGTAAVAAAAGATVVLERSLRRGSGAAVRAGLQYAFDRGAELVVTLDADGQHDPTEIEGLAKPVVEGRADIAQGTRIENSAHVSGSSVRALGVSAFGRFLKRALRVEVTDPSNGFRAISRNAYQQLRLSEDQFYVGELIVNAARSGLGIEEVPVTVHPRRSGESKKPQSMLYGWGFAKGILRAMLHPFERT